MAYVIQRIFQAAGNSKGSHSQAVMRYWDGNKWTNDLDAAEHYDQLSDACTVYCEVVARERRGIYATEYSIRMV